MKKVIQIVLVVVIIGLAYVLVDQILTPMKFQTAKSTRETAVIERLKDIRIAQRAYKQVNQKYAPSFDSLIYFVLNDSLTFEKAIGSADDSVAVAKGLVKKETFKMAAIDTIFGAKKLSPDQIKSFALIPYGNGTKFIMDAGTFTTESKVVVPVFECKAPYKDFLSDLDMQELVNLIDERKTFEKYPGLKVGSMTEATNDAGNWE